MLFLEMGVSSFIYKKLPATVGEAQKVDWR